MHDEALEEMRRAVDRAEDDPDGVAALAQARLDELGADAEVTEIGAVSWWALGLSARESNDLRRADAVLADGVRAADAIGNRDLAAEIRSSRALVLAYRGDVHGALQELLAAEDGLGPAALARVLMQRGLVLQRAGHLDAALDAYSRARPALVAAGDRVREIRLLSNSAIAAAYLHDFERAEEDLLRARSLAEETENAFQVASCAHNLGFLHGRRGDVPGALGWFDRVAVDDPRYGTEARSSSILLLDRAEVLMGGGLVTEALEAAEEARSRLDGTENAVELAEADLVVARIATAAGDLELATTSALRAADAFRRQERWSWESLAAAIAFLAAHGSGATRLRVVADASNRNEARVLAHRATELALALEGTEWSSEARLVATLAGSLWQRAGDDERALAMLDPVGASRRSGSAIQRVQAWQAEALARFLRGDLPGSRRAIRAGLDTISSHRTTMAATDLRATVSSIGDRLASWLVELALDGGPRDLLRAAEAWRAGSLVAPVAAPADPELERLLGELRAADADRRVGAADADARRARLEVAVRDRSRQLRSTGTKPEAPRFDPSALAAALGDRLLVEFVEVDGALHVVSMVDGRAAHRRVADPFLLAPEIQSVRACLQRMSRSVGSARSIASAQETLTLAAQRLADALFAGVRLPEGRPVVVVPTGVLHDVPWAALPGLAERPFVVSPSASVWTSAAAVGERSVGGGVLLAAGPDLAGAVDEVRAIAELWPDATVLVEEAATVDAVLGRLAGAQVAHFAAHGDFRVDNPQLCALRLGDGDLRVYDLERVTSIPPVVVLSACDAGAVAVHAGDEVQGFAAAVLGLGASSLIAPVVPVDDEVTAAMLTILHRELAAGRSPATALHAARITTGPGGGAAGAKAIAAAASFLAFGS